MRKFIFFILLFLMFWSRAQAEVVNLVKDTFDNTYTYYYDSNLERNRYLIASKYLFGNNIAYCLEIGKSIDSFVYDTSTFFDNINISDEDLEYIKLISYYGYDYPGHQTDKYYMATQELIWNRLISRPILWTIGLTPNYYYDLSYEKEEILNLFKKHNIKPSFDGTTFDFVLGEDFILEDNNNVLSMYDSLNDDVIIDGNKLIIGKFFDDEEIILKKHDYNNRNFLLYTSGSSQKMMSVGSIQGASSYIKVNLIGGSISINKLDKDTGSDISQGEAMLDGSIYGVYDLNDELVDTLVIGEKESVNYLPVGKYYLKEIKAGLGYLLDSEMYYFDITPDNFEVNLTVYDEVIKRKVDLFKVYASDETGFLVGEANIRFDIYNSNNELVDFVVTDNDGYATIELSYGSYVFKQINSTENYYKIDDFIVDIDTYDDRPIYKLISNSEIKAKLKVIKKDFDTGNIITDSKIKFKIFDVNNNEYVSFKVNYPENEVIDTFEINDEGFFITPYELDSGEYILYEVDELMDGYLYNNQGIRFMIGDSSNLINDEDYGVIVEVNFYNKRVKGQINLTKYGEKVIYKDNSFYYDKILLSDVKFNLYASNDIYENNELLYASDGLVSEIVTDINGNCLIDNLPLGKYYLKEVSSNNGNVISDDVYYIELNYKDQYTEKVVYGLDVYNYLEKGKLIINKYESGTDIRVSNTLIEVYTIDDILVYKGYTNNSGQIVIDNLPYGEYFISEVEASTGYRLLNDKIYFKIEDDEKTIDIYNDRIKVPNTGIDVGIKNILLLFGILIVGILIIVFFENKKVVIICSMVILLGIGYFGMYFYRYYSDNINNKKSVKAFLDDNIDAIKEEKYKYNALVEIPSISLKRGILEIDNLYNDVKYNVELIEENNDRIVLAAHNGNSHNSYFGKLSDLELGDEINYYYNGKIYRYIYSDSYEIRKNGYADIYTSDNKKSVILITCKDNSDDGQVVYIGYLEQISDY